MPEHRREGAVAEAVPERTLTRGNLLARNTLWNLLGSCAPMLVAIASFPLIKHALGVDRLGVLTLAWAVIGYFGLFDFGLSRGLTKLIAEKIGSGKHEDIPSIVWTSLAMMLVLSLLGMAIAATLSPWLVYRILKVPAAIQPETLTSFYWLAGSLPVVIITAGLRGVLEAVQEFRIATAIRIPMGTLTYLGPVAVLPLSHRLAPIVMVLVAGRLLGCIAHLFACLHVLPGLRHRVSIGREWIAELLSFGSWMTVSNVISPLLVTLDRFVIGAIISITAVAYYATPYELVTKLWLVPASIVGVLFPAFSTTMASDRHRAALLFDRGTKYVFLMLFPVTLLLVAFAPEVLALWLGADFSRQSAPVLRWLAVAVFINSVGQVSFCQIQSAGRPAITAKLNLAEVPVYLALLWVFIHRFGIVGAAMAWMLRASLDTALLFYFSRRLLPESQWTRKLAARIAGALVVIGIPCAVASLQARGLLVTVSLIVAAAATWEYMLSADERSMFRSYFQSLHVSS